jgi:hypothetical protein
MLVLGLAGSAATWAENTILTDQVPGLYENDSPYELGTVFKTTVGTHMTKVRIYTNSSEGGEHMVRLWLRDDSSVVAGPYAWSFDSGTEGWKEYTLPEPVSLTADTDYVIAVSNSSDQWYASAWYGFDAPITNGPLVTYVGSGVFTTTLGTMPTQAWNNSNYFRDVVLGDVLVAGSPVPTAGAVDVPRDAVLSWKPGKFAGTHDVYFGTSADAVGNASKTDPMGVLVSQDQAIASYDPAGLLAFGQTCYWRIDEVNVPEKPGLYKGDIWSFTVEPYGYRITTPITATASSFSNTLTQPGKTIDGSGMDALDRHSISSSQMWLSKKNVTPIWIQYKFDSPYKLYQMWVWNSNQLGEPDYGFGAKEVTIECSTDGNTWTAVGAVTEFAQAPGEENYEHNTTVDFGGVMAKYVRLTIRNNWADGTKQAGLSEVRFFFIPVKAFEPAPASGTPGVGLDTVLNWRPGREAVKHEVYLGTDPNALSKVATVTEHRYVLNSAGLEYDKTYYWKVNEVNDAATPKSWEGDVWNFTTVEYKAVDDFESYNDLCNRIFWSWVDQYGYNASTECGGASAAGNGTGASVGNAQAPYADKTNRNSGVQSLPVFFDNTMSPYYSETYREWTTPQSWTGGGANTLVVYLRGDAPAFLETSPGTILMNGIGTDIWATNDEFRYVYKQLSGNGSIVARVDSLTRSDEWSKAGVMIRETLEGGSAHAFVAATPTLTPTTHGISYQRRLVTGLDSTNTDVNMAPATLPYWVKLTRTGNVFTAQRSLNGTTWVDIVPTTPLTFTMANNVYIGLAVTSHLATAVSGATFSNVSTTGGVSGSWQVAEIGATQVEGNKPETCYVAVQDSGGKTKVVSSLDPSWIASGVWQEWNIPLSQFTSAGVNLNGVKQIIIGVGDRNAPKAGGKGKLNIDDIRLTRVATP